MPQVLRLDQDIEVERLEGTMSDNIEKIPARSIPPSAYVRWNNNHHGYLNITACTDCGMRAHRDDAHPANPCRLCGGELEDFVARWVSTTPKRKWWSLNFFPKRSGYWIKREESNDCVREI